MGLFLYNSLCFSQFAEAPQVRDVHDHVVYAAFCVNPWKTNLGIFNRSFTATYQLTFILIII